MTDRPVLLDTHVWFRYQVTPARLRPGALAAIDEAVLRNSVFVSPITVWELALLERDGRVELSGGVKRWTTLALAQPGIHLLPYTAEIAIESAHLPLPMHKDPSDRILVASARIEKMTLITSDKAILAFAKSSGLPHVRA
jgi:PIN domain nuclease of toxin-antitoxin system